MKVVVSCDGIFERDYYLEAVEAVLDVVGEQCELYTLVHKHGSVVGPIEERKIHSTYLTNITKNWRDLLSKSHLIPGASKNLFIPCSVDLIINISRGFSHGIKKCDETKMLSFILEDVNSRDRKKGFVEKLFSPFVRSFQRKSLAQVDELWVSSKSLIPSGVEAKEVSPVIKLGDYKILPDAMFQRDYILVNAEPLNEEEALRVIEILSGRNEKFKFVGIDDHLEGIKKGNEIYFFGNRCGGELAPLLNGCKYLIDFETENLPALTLKAMACARPVFSIGNRFISHGEGLYSTSKEDAFKSELIVAKFDKNEVRGRALAFEELKFKHQIKRYLENLNPNKRSEEETSTCC